MRHDNDRCERYSAFFTKEYLMGPNSIRLLDELIRRCSADARFDRTLDLGCGLAVTSVFLANETPAKSVVALDLWVSATDNYERIRRLGLAEKIMPIHGDAMDMPFARGCFDAIVSVDSYHYFGCRKGVFEEKILPFVREGGYVMIAIPGLRRQPDGELRTLFETWAEGDDAQLFQTAAWWKALLEEACGDRCDVTVEEADCFDAAWADWFDSGHEYGIRDREFLAKGLDRVLNFVLIYIRNRKGAEKKRQSMVDK